MVLIFHVLLEALRGLAGVANGPHATVELAGDVLNRRFVSINGNVAEHAIGEAELVRKQLHDFMIDLGVEQRLYYFFSPLQRTVRRGYRAVGFELGGRGQQVGTLFAIVEYGRNGREGIHYNQQVELFHRFLHFRHTGLGVGRVAPQHHGPGVVWLLQVFFGFQDTVNPSGYRNAFLVHHGFGFAVLVPHGKAAFQVVQILFPDS